MRNLLLALTMITIASDGRAVGPQGPTISAKCAREITVETYIWRDPLVLMDRTRALPSVSLIKRNSDLV